MVDRLWLFKPRPNDHNMSAQHTATLLDATCCARLAALLRHVGCCWLKFENGQIWVNNIQHVALTSCDRLATRTFLTPELTDFAGQTVVARVKGGQSRYFWLCWQCQYKHCPLNWRKPEKAVFQDRKTPKTKLVAIHKGAKLAKDHSFLRFIGW